MLENRRLMEDIECRIVNYATGIIMKTLSIVIITGCLSLLVFGCIAGEVVVHKSSEKFDPFAVRDEILKQHQWQESLRQQQQLDILKSLPAGCLPLSEPYLYYECGAKYYRPYEHQNQQLFIQVDAPALIQHNLIE